MKIAILSCANLSRAQYIYKYLHLLDLYNCEYDVIFWNRTLESIDIDCKANFISYDQFIDSYKPLKEKIGAYIKFAQFVNKTINQNKYDKLIILTTPMAISVLIQCFGKYRKKYLFDFRDLTKEFFYPYKKVVQKIANNSELFITSSPGYLNYFVTKKISNYALCHNTFSEIAFKQNLKLNKSDIIRISYWGAIRQVDYNKKICELFGNDKRFIFSYHGDGAYKELKKFCEDKGFENIYFTGRYGLQDIQKFAEETDILFNAYETDFVTTPSLAVKVYDSIEYRLPLVISQGTFMETYLKDTNYTFLFEASRDKIDELYNWYKSLDEQLVNKDFNAMYDQVEKDDVIFQEKLKVFVGE